MAIRSAIMPLAQKPTPKSIMVSDERPRSARYGCSRTSLSNRNCNGLFGALFSTTGAGFAAGFGRGVSLVFGVSSDSPASGLDSTDMASGSRLNHSMAFKAAAWMLTSSIRAMKSRALPPCLHSLKQFQMFLLMLTRNCVGLLPLWMGHGPLRSEEHTSE